MIKIKLTRDQARLIEQNCLPYMVMLTEMKVHDTSTLGPEYFISKILNSLITEVHVSFKRKLLGKGNNLSFPFTDAHGIAFYSLFLTHPIEAKQEYLINLRQQVCDIMHKQI